MPIYEGGQCRQNQFYSSEIYTEPAQWQLFSSFLLERWLGLFGGLQLLRPSPVTPSVSHPFFLKVICVCMQALGGSACFVQANSARCAI